MVNQIESESINCQTNVGSTTLPYLSFIWGILRPPLLQSIVDITFSVQGDASAAKSTKGSHGELRFLAALGFWFSHQRS